MLPKLAESIEQVAVLCH